MAKKTHYKIEKDINRILFNLTSIVTVIAIGMTLIEFFTRGAFPPTRISIFYMGVLLIYSLHKEALRWLEKKGTKKKQKKGEYFVYTWVIMTTILYLINFLSKDYFSYYSSGQPVSVLMETTYTALEVCGVFIFTRLLKIGVVHFFRRK